MQSVQDLPSPLMAHRPPMNKKLDMKAQAELKIKWAIRRHIRGLGSKERLQGTYISAAAKHSKVQLQAELQVALQMFLERLVQLHRATSRVQQADDPRPPLLVFQLHSHFLTYQRRQIRRLLPKAAASGIDVNQLIATLGHSPQLLWDNLDPMYDAATPGPVEGASPLKSPPTQMAMYTSARPHSAAPVAISSTVQGTKTTRPTIKPGNNSKTATGNTWMPMEVQLNTAATGQQSQNLSQQIRIPDVTIKEAAQQAGPQAADHISGTTNNAVRQSTDGQGRLVPAVSVGAADVPLELSMTQLQEDRHGSAVERQSTDELGLDDEAQAAAEMERKESISRHVLAWKKCQQEMENPHGQYMLLPEWAAQGIDPEAVMAGMLAGDAASDRPSEDLQNWCDSSQQGEPAGERDVTMAQAQDCTQPQSEDADTVGCSTMPAQKPEQGTAGDTHGPHLENNVHDTHRSHVRPSTCEGLRMHSPPQGSRSPGRSIMSAPAAQHKSKQQEHMFHSTMSLHGQAQATPDRPQRSIVQHTSDIYYPHTSPGQARNHTCDASMLHPAALLPSPYPQDTYAVRPHAAGAILRPRPHTSPAPYQPQDWTWTIPSTGTGGKKGVNGPCTYSWDTIRVHPPATPPNPYEPQPYPRTRSAGRLQGGSLSTKWQWRPPTPTLLGEPTYEQCWENFLTGWVIPSLGTIQKEVGANPLLDTGLLQDTMTAQGDEDDAESDPVMVSSSQLMPGALRMRSEFEGRNTGGGKDGGGGGGSGGARPTMCMYSTISRPHDSSALPFTCLLPANNQKLTSTCLLPANNQKLTSTQLPNASNQDSRPSSPSSRSAPPSPSRKASSPPRTHHFVSFLPPPHRPTTSQAKRNPPEPPPTPPRKNKIPTQKRLSSPSRSRCSSPTNRRPGTTVSHQSNPTAVSTSNAFIRISADSFIPTGQFTAISSAASSISNIGDDFLLSDSASMTTQDFPSYAHLSDIDTRITSLIGAPKKFPSWFKPQSEELFLKCHDFREDSLLRSSSSGFSDARSECSWAG